MQSLVLVFHVALSIGVIGLVLIQHGKGADAGAAFGSGASATVFGARGAASFMTRMTTLLVSLFFLTSLTLFYLAAHRDRGTGSVTELPGDVPASITSPADEPAASGNSDLPDSDTAAPAASEAASEEPTSATPAAELPADDLPAADALPADPGSEADSDPADEAGDLPAPE